MKEKTAPPKQTQPAESETKAPPKPAEEEDAGDGLWVFGLLADIFGPTPEAIPPQDEAPRPL